MPRSTDPRWGWAASALGALAAGALVLAVGTRVTFQPGALAFPCFVLALVAAAGAIGGARARNALGPVLATIRIAIVLLALGVWEGEGRVLWAALAVWFAVHDAREGLSAKRPLLPVALGLAVALGFNALRPGAPAARMLLVALVAALAAAQFGPDPRDPSSS